MVNLRGLLSDCLKNTSAHGPSRLIDENNNLCIKVLWGVVLLGSCAVFCLHSSSLIIKYLNHETIVSVNLDGIEFIVPDIYICNEHPASKLIMNHHVETKNPEYYEITSIINGNIVLLHDTLSRHEMSGFSSEFVDQVFFDRNYSDFIGGFVPNALSHLSFSTLFRRVPHHEYHACYKLKDEYKKHIFQYDALSFILYTDVHWFSPPIEETNRTDFHKHHSTHPLRNYPYESAVSHTIFITPPGQYPHHDNIHLRATRGRSNLMEITMIYYQRQNRKTFPCLKKKKTVTYYNQLDNNNPMTYTFTQKDCMYQLFQKKLLQKHNCVTTTIPLSVELWSNKSIKRCPGSIARNHYYWASAFSVATSQDPDYTRCRKDVVCDIPVYKTDTQSLPILDKQLQMLVNASYRTNNKLYRNMFNTFNARDRMNWEDNWQLEKAIKESYMFISFTAPHMHSSVYKESFAYELKSLLSDIGGILGFYLGISLVTMWEICGFGVKHASM